MKNDLSVVDYFWGLGAIVCVYDGVFNLHGQKSKGLVLFVMGLLWGGRLVIYLFLRSRGKGEDKRYTAFRLDWEQKGKNVWKEAYKKIFLTQGLLNLFVCIPIWYHYARGIDRWNIINILGVLLFILGFFLETYADIILYQSKKLQMKNETFTFCQKWPWNKSRHPNYLGEIILWWGIFLTSIQSFFDIWMGISALLVTGLLLKVSGVPLLEKEFLKRPNSEKYFSLNQFLPF